MKQIKKNPAVEAYVKDVQSRKDSMSSVEMGLTSLSKLFENVVNNTDIGNKLLESMNKKMDSILDFAGIGNTFENLMNFTRNEDPTIDKKREKKDRPENRVDDLVGRFEKEESEYSSTDYSSHLINITDILQQILDKDSPKANDKKGKKEKETHENVKKSKGVEKIKNLDDNASQITKFSKAVERMHIAFDGKLNRSLKVFSRLIARMFDKKFQVNLKVTAASLMVFSNELKILSEAMRLSVFNMKNFLKVIWMISLSLLSPMFIGGMASLQTFFKTMQEGLNAKKEDRKNSFSYKLISISLGILAIVGALLLVKFVSFKDLGMVLGFLTALALIIRLFMPRGGVSITKNITQNSNNISGYKNGGMLGMIAMGLALIVLVIAALSEVNWVPCLTLVVFIIAIYAAIAIGNKMTKGGNAMGGLPGFALGLSILVLVIVALGELTKQDWINAGFIVGFIFAVSLAIRIAGGGIKGMFGFAVGITILILCVIALGDLSKQEWIAAGFLIAFIYGVAGAIRFANMGRGANIKKFVGSFIILVAVTVAAIYILNKAGKGSYANVAMFITMIMSITMMYYFVWKRMGRMKSFEKIDGYVKMMIKSMLLVALSVAIMSVFQPDFNTILLLITSVAAITGLYYLIGTKLKDLDFETIDEQIKNMIKNLLLISVAVAIMSIFKPSLNTVLLLVTSMVAIVGMYYFVSQIFKSKTKFDKIDAMVKSMAISLILVSAALLIAGASNINWKIFGIMMLTMLSIVAVYAIVGIPAVSTLVALGSVVMLLAMGTFLLVTIIMSIISYIPVDRKGIDNVCESLKSIVITFAKLLILTPFALAAAVMMIPVMVVSILLAVTLLILSSFNIDKQKIDAFTQSLSTIITTYGSLVVSAAVGLVAAVLMIPIVVSALLFATLLKIIEFINVSPDQISVFNKSLALIVNGYSEIGLIKAAKSAAISILLTPVMFLSLNAAILLKFISALSIDQNNLINYGKSLNTLVDSFGNIGIKKAFKASVASIALTPVILTGLLFAKLMQEIGNTTIKEEQIQTFNKSLSSFITSFSDEIMGTVAKMKKMEPGLKALGQLISVSKGFADVVISMSNMNYNEYEVKDGKLVLKSVRKISDTEILKVGTNVGTLLGALINPISILNSNSEYFDFNGVKVINPFKKGWFGKNKGADRISQIGNAYKPIFENIKTITASASLLSDPKMMNSINSGISSYMDTTMKIFTKLSSNPIPNQERFTALNNYEQFLSNFKINREFVGSDIKKYTLNVSDFFDTLCNTLEKVGAGEFANGSSINDLTFFLDKLDNFKWNNLNKGLKEVGDNTARIVKNINGLNLEKTLLFKQTLEYMTSQQSNINMAKLVDKLNELIAGIVIYQESQLQTQEYTKKSIDQIAEGNKQQKELQKKLDERGSKAPTLDDFNALINILMEKMGSTTTSILLNKFKVSLSDQLGNEIGRKGP